MADHLGRGRTAVLAERALTTREPASGLSGRGRRRWYASWWVRVVAVFAASRVITTTIMLVMASQQDKNAWTDASPDYWDYSSLWDSRWYELIGYGGYPRYLPIDDEGYIDQNAWAFMPAYPWLVRMITELVSGNWRAVAVIVSLAFALGAALLLYRLLVRFLEPGQTLFAVVLFCVAPASPILQVGYAESMFLFLLILALLLLVKRDYWMMVPVIAVMSVTRPGTLALSLTLGLHFLVRWFTRARDPFPVAERWRVVAVTAISLPFGFAWMVIAASVTGNPHAYLDTELAWRADYIGHAHLLPFTSWFQGAEWWLPSPLGILAVVALLIATVLLYSSRAVGRLGTDLRLWMISYSLYLFAVFFPQSSTFRLLMPLFPLLGVLALPRKWWYRVLLIAVFLGLQWGWLLLMWGIDGADWTPP